MDDHKLQLIIADLNDKFSNSDGEVVYWFTVYHTPTLLGVCIDDCENWEISHKDVLNEDGTLSGEKVYVGVQYDIDQGDIDETIVSQSFDYIWNKFKKQIAKYEGDID